MFSSTPDLKLKLDSQGDDSGSLLVPGQAATGIPRSSIRWGTMMPEERKWRWRRWDQTWVPLLEGGLILLMGLISLAIGKPLLFASLGPTAYEQIEKPELPSARFYNVVVGHWIGMGCGFAGIALLHAWNAPKPMVVGHFDAIRVGACAIAVALTALLTLAVKAGQPAAYATALLVAVGSMQRASDAWSIALGVLILAAVGEPIRRMRLISSASREKHESSLDNRVA